jgi:hypothetical protein
LFVLFGVRDTRTGQGEREQGNELDHNNALQHDVGPSLAV